MRVDEAGSKRSVAQIDGFGAGGKCRVCADGGDLAVNHDDEAGGNHVIALTVEHVGGFEDVGLIGGA